MCKTSIFNKNRNIVAARATVYMRSIEQQFFFFPQTALKFFFNFMAGAIL